MVEATHKGFNTTMVEANLEGVAMLEVTLKAVAEVVVEAVAEAEVKDMLDRFGSEMNPFHSFMKMQHLQFSEFAKLRKPLVI